MGLRTVVAAERGEKVAVKTLRRIELALNLPTGCIDDYLAEKIDRLPDTTPPRVGGQRAVDRLLSMTHEELVREAALYDEVEPGSGEDWLQRVLAIRKRARETHQTNKASLRDATQR